MSEIRQIAYVFPVSDELLADVLPPTPEQLVDWKRRREEREAEQRHQLGQHAHRMTFATGLRRAILELHAPVQDSTYAHPICHGCDGDGYDWEPPEWPCRTYVLARDGVA